MRGRQQGFTLIELLVVLAILGVLAAAILPLGESLLRAQKERELQESLWQIRGALDEYKAAVTQKVIASPTESGYPPDLDTLVRGADDVRPEHAGQRVYFLRRLPRDPFADPTLPASQTWHLRSYLSAPDKPMPGADVFDVQSAAPGEALDGTAYATW